MRLCQNCNYKIFNDDSQFCPNCGILLRSNLVLQGKRQYKFPKRTFKDPALMIPLTGGLIIVIILITAVIVQSSQPPDALTLDKPVLESVHTINPYSEISTQNFEYFNNSIYFINEKPDSIVKMTLNEAQTNITSIKSYPLTTNIVLSSVGELKFITNGTMSFVWMIDGGSSLLYKVHGSTSAGTYTLETPIHLPCDQPSKYSTATTYCGLGDIQLIGNTLYEVASYYQQSDARFLGNLLREYNLQNNSITKIYSLPNQKAFTIADSGQDVYIGINEGNSTNQLILNYEDLISIDEGVMGPGLGGFFKFDVGTGIAQNTIQYSILTTAKFIQSGLKLSNMLYENNSLLLLYYNNQSQQLVKFAKYKLEKIGPSLNRTMDV